MRLIKVDRKGDINILLSPRIAYQRETQHIKDYSAINMQKTARAFEKVLFLLHSCFSSSLQQRDIALPV